MRASAIAISCVLLLAAPANAQTQNDDDESALLVKEARGKLQKKQYDRAGTLLDRAIEVNPRRLEAYILRASVYGVKKQYKQGVALMRRAQALAPDDENVLVALGTQLMLAGEFDEGVPLLEKVVARWPKRYEAHALLGHHYADRGEWAKAITALEAYLATRPAALAGEDPLHQVPLADAYLRGGDPPRARRMFAAILKDHPRDESARIGLAWATAAIDCREARVLFVELRPLTGKYPDILLVEGRCALLTGKGSDALALARRYLEARPDSAAGHGLAGEALADAGNFDGARGELSEARRLDATNRRWSFKLARMERLSGHAGTAITLLEQLGPPVPGDPEWSVELGEALLADGRIADAGELIAPVVAAHPDDGGARTVYGDALYRQDDAAGAVVQLERALALAPSGRVRSLLVDALNVVAVAALRAGKLDDAEARLVRADAIARSPRTGKNLGIVRLEAGRPAAAIEPLGEAAAGGDDAAALLLYGRALGLSGDVAAARRAFARARTLYKDDPAGRVELAIEVAAMELDAGEPERAVDALEGVTGVPAAARARVDQALVSAWHAAALHALATGASARAQKWLEAAEKKAVPGELVAIRCDLALAATAAGDREAALKRLRTLSKAGAACPFPAPADHLAVPILIAVNEGMQPARAGKALDQLDALAKQATGAAQKLWATAIRVVAMTAAADAYAKGNSKKARELLVRARRAEARGVSPELAHDLAALDVSDGKGAAAVPVLQGLTGEVPEAWITLGLAYEQDGKPLDALDAYRRADKAGVKFAPLAEWIAAKERVFGGAP